MNYDLDTRYSGGIYYQNLDSTSNEFNSTAYTIKRLNKTFIPSHLFRITYDNVPAYGQSSLIASFQIILASSESSSYVVLKYSSCIFRNRLFGIYYNQSFFYESNPCYATNVNQIGTWVFDVLAQSGK